MAQVAVCSCMKPAKASIWALLNPASSNARTCSFILQTLSCWSCLQGRRSAPQSSFGSQLSYEPFALAQLLSDWEQIVDFNFAERGVHPVPLHEFLEMAGEGVEPLLDTPINYHGDLALRERNAALYGDTKPENVLVNIGASKASYLLANTLMEPGDELAVMQPTHMQVEGAARNRGAMIRSFNLDGTQGRKSGDLIGRCDINCERRSSSARHHAAPKHRLR